MRHLHFHFVCASFSLGLAVFMFGLSGWQLLWLGAGAHGVIVPIQVSLTLSVLLGSVLLIYALDGIRRELRWPTPRYQPSGAEHGR